jgi:hypothetical protein
MVIRTLSLRITVEVQINHNIPLSLTVSNGATQTQNLTRQHPPDQANSMATLVVGRDSNIDELGRGVGIAEGNDGNVDVGSLLDSLGVGAGISDDNQAGFLEGAGDVVSEVTGGETTCDGNGSGVCGELQDSALAIGTGGDDADIGWVVNGGDDAGCENNLLPVKRKYIRNAPFSSFFQFADMRRDSSIPGLANIQDVDSIRASLPEVWLHVNLHVLGSQMALSCEEHLNVLRSGVENRGKV